MTNDDSAPAGAKPTIIDLEAETVIEDNIQDDPKSAAPPPRKPARRKFSWAGIGMLAALAAATIAGGWIYKETLATYFPSDALQAATTRIDVLEAQSKTLNDQLTALANQAEQLRGTLANSTAQSDEASAAVRNLSARATDVDSRIATVENAAAALKADLAKQRSATPQATPGTTVPIDQAALAGLAQRIDAIEKDVASLKTARTPDDAAARTAALSQALADLKAKIAAGTAYKDEHERIARMVPAAAGLEVLGARAADGLPNAAGLAAELRAGLDVLPKPAGEQPADAGYLASFWNALGHVVTIRNVGEADWPALAARAAELADGWRLSPAPSR